MTTVRAALLLLLATLAAMLPHALLDDWTGTEGRRIQIAQEMVRNGDYMVATLFGEPNFAKPPLHYWLLAACGRAFGWGHVSMRLPAIVGVWLLALLAWRLHRRAFGAGAAWVAALGVVCAPLVVAQFASAEIDPAFACLTTGSLWCLAFGVARQRPGIVAIGGLLGGLALLDKGPPYFVFAFGALAVWWRHRRWRGIVAWLVPLAAVPAAYFVPLFAGHAAMAEVAGVAGDETVGRLLSYEWASVIDTPLFFVRALLVQLPLVMWCFWEFRSTRDARMGPEDLTLRMCSAAAVGAVLVLALFPGKPTRYLLPNVPLFTFAVAPAAAHYARRCVAIGGIGRAVVRAAGVLGACGLIAVPFLPAPLPARTPILMLALALAPVLVRRPLQLVAMCFWLPVLAAWTAIADYDASWAVGTRAREVHGPQLARELDRIGPSVREELVGFGHLNGSILLGAGLLPRGSEPATAQPTARYVLREGERTPPLPDLTGYAERLRFCLPGQYFVVEERLGSGK